MLRPAKLALVFLTVAFGQSVWADSYVPFRDYRLAGPIGRFYVVVKQSNGWGRDPGRGGPVEVVFAERKQGNPPVKSAVTGLKLDKVIPNPEVRVRAGDVIHGRGRLDRAPGDVLISSTGLGFATLDVYGYNFGTDPKARRFRNAVLIVANDGTVLHKLAMLDLFSEWEFFTFDTSAGGAWWSGGGWIDETRKQVIVVGASRSWFPNRRLFRTIDWKTGQVRKATSDVIVTAIREVNRGALNLALDLTVEFKYQDAKQHLPSILSRHELPVATRLRSAVALALLGDKRGAKFVKDVAMRKPTKYDEDQDYAIRHLPAVLGDESAEILRNIIYSGGDRFFYKSAWYAMSELETKAVPTIIEMLKERQKPNAQYFAAECISLIGKDAKQATPTLIEILRGHTDSQDKRRINGIVLNALKGIGGEAQRAVPVLRELETRAKEDWEQLKSRKGATNRRSFDDELWDAEYYYKQVVDTLQTLDNKKVVE